MRWNPKLPETETRNLKPEALMRGATNMQVSTLILNPEPKLPEYRNPKPEARNPKLETRNPKPKKKLESRNPKPETRNETWKSKPETRNGGPVHDKRAGLTPNP